MVEILLYAAATIAVAYIFYRRGYIDGTDDALDDVMAELNGQTYGSIRELAEELMKVADECEREKGE